MNPHTRELISVIAESLTAIGTVGAVIVALWLANRQSRPALRVRACFVSMVTLGQNVADSPEYFQISVVNAGYQDVVINGLQWTVGVIRKRHLIQIPELPPLAPRLPHRLPPRETTTFLFPKAEFLANFAKLIPARHSGLLGKLLARPVRAGVYLSTGEYFLVPPASAVLDELDAHHGAV